MTKYFYFLLFSLSVISNLFSQGINIPTEFSQDGKLYKNQNNSSVVLAQFEANEECLVISYLGKDQYKIKYKDYIGFVDSQYLVFNDEIDDLFYDFQDTERLKTIKEEELRRQKIKEIVNSGKDNINESAKQDSIIKVRVEAEKQIAFEKEALERKLEAELLAREKQESIAKFLEAEKQKTLEQEALARKLEAERLEREKQESIAKFLEEKKQKAIEQEALERKLEAELIEHAKQDSIVKVRAEAEKQIALEKEALERKLAAERLEREKQ